jgi:hypothetical protein
MNHTLIAALILAVSIPTGTLPAWAADAAATKTAETEQVPSLPDALRRFIPERGIGSSAPASRWDYGFLTGNGRIGAIVYGQPIDETIVFNHARLYLPIPRPPVADLGKRFPEVRRIIREKGHKDAVAFSDKQAQQQGHFWYQSDPYHLAFELKLNMPTSGAVTNYLRTTDFQTGEVAVRFQDADGEVVRRLFASEPGNAIVMSIARPNGKPVSLTLTPESNIDKLKASPRDDLVNRGQPVDNFLKSELRVEKDWILYENAYTAAPGGYDNAVRVIAKGGRVESDGDSIKVTAANEVLLIAGIEWYAKRQPGSLAALKKRLAALPTNYQALLKPHASTWSAKFNRVTLDLGGGADRQLASEELLARAKAGGFKRVPPALMEKLYDACRFYFLCSSGELPPNLQGIWNGVFTAPWGGSYTYDTNIEMAMDSALSANMPEGMDGFFRLIESLLPDWRANAKNLFGARGVVGQISGSPNTGLNLAYGGQWAWQFWPSGAGWIASYYFDYYRFTGDKTFLAKRAVPLMKDIALFYEDYLTETDDKGFYIFRPSCSPEVGGLTWSDNSVLDVAVAKELLTNLIAACDELRIEQDNVAKWRAMLKKMPPYQIGPDGALAEWADGSFRHAYAHRHHSPFYPIFRSFEFTPDGTPELWKAVNVAYSKKVDQWLRKTRVDNAGIPFGRAFNAQCAAYLGRGDKVEEILNAMTDRIYPSMFMALSPNNLFNFDGLGAYPDIINRSLAFSLNGTLDLLRAIPPGWETGSITGILARGQLKIDRLSWNQSKRMVNLALTSGIAQTITVRVGTTTRNITLPANKKSELELHYEL